MSIKFDLNMPGVSSLINLNENQKAGVLGKLVENFRRLQNYFDTASQVEGTVLLAFSLPLGGGQVKIPHGLGNVPKDVILTRLLAPSGAKLIVHHGLFDSTNIVVSATGTGSDLKARLLVGTFTSSDSAAVESSETQEFVGKA